MNATTALAMAFLEGKVLTIKTAFRDFGITNLPRECGRLIERKFDVRLARVTKVGVTRYNVRCTWNEYRLPDTDYNKEGRTKMEEYVIERVPTYKNSTKTAERQQLNLL